MLNGLCAWRLRRKAEFHFHSHCFTFIASSLLAIVAFLHPIFYPFLNLIIVRSTSMTRPLCDSPMVKHCHPCFSSQSYKFLLSFKASSLKSHLSSSFIDKKFSSTFQLRSNTSKLVCCSKRSTRPVASLGGFLGGIFRGTDTGESTRQQYASTIAVINGLEAEMSALSDSQLRDKTSVLKERAQTGESLDSLLPVSLENELSSNYLVSCSIPC